jgi:guanylate kinase
VERSAFPIVISGPSGVGKTSICQGLLAEDPETAYSVSVTTRPVRPGEEDRRDYEFVQDVTFDALVMMNELAEWAVVHGHRYGTRKKFIQETVAGGRDVVMDVDVQGGMSIKELYPESVLIFVLPPSPAALEERLRRRATDDEEAIQTRLTNSLDELKWAQRYDYVVVNDVLDEAVREAKAIVVAERLRTSRVRLD